MRKDFEAYVQQTRPHPRPEAVVQGPDYRITVLTDRLLRLEYQAEGRFTEQATQCVVCRDFPCPPFRVMETDTSLEIVTKELHLYYDKKPFSTQGLRIQLVQSFGVYGSLWSYGDSLLDLKGTARTLDQANGAVPLEHGLMSREGFSVLDDSASAVFDEQGYLQPRSAPEQDLYFFGYGHDYLGCLRDFYRLCGHTPLVPRFALGNWWSRYYPYTEQSYLELMDRFQEKQLPFSTAVIDMDWHLTQIPRRYGSGWTGYTWNPDFFPDPGRFLSALHQRGLRVTLNLHPADGVNAHEDAYPEMARALGIDAENEDKIPFDPTNPAFVEAYFQYLHHPHEALGVDFWWIDWQQGSHCAIPNMDPLWLLNHQHFVDNGRDGKLPLTFSRYAGIGSHRYPVGFSGDTVTTWESLDFQPYFTANASNVGYTWWSHDIGGHMQGARSDELTVRWVQFGVFSPIMRLHSSCSPFYGKEPWNYGMEAEQILSDFLRLRHRLIPYLYTMDYLTAEEGLPLLRPMYYHHDTDPAYHVPNEYWFGTEMIACPITTPLDPETLLACFHAWLPEGMYYDFFTRNVYRGGRTLALYRPLHLIPVLVPAGSILPLAPDYMHSHLRNPEVLELRVYHGADGGFTLTEDDCSGRQDAPVQRSHFRYTLTQEGALLHMEQSGGGAVPENREYRISICGIAQPDFVWLEGEAQLQWQYDNSEKALLVTLTGHSIGWFSLHVGLSCWEIALRDKVAQVYSLLQRAQISYGLKDQIYNAVLQGQNTASILAALTGMELKPALLGPLAEILTMDL